MNFITTAIYKVSSTARTLFDKVYSVYSQFNFTGLWRYNPLREENRSLEAAISNMRNRYSGEIEKKTGEIKRDYEERFRQAISEERERISKKMEGQIRGLESRLTEVQRYFKTIRRTVKKYENLDLSNEARVVELEKKIASYQNSLKEQTNYMHMYATTVDQIIDLKQQVPELNEMISQLRGELQAERKTLSILKKSHESQSSSFVAEIVELNRFSGVTEECIIELSENEGNYRVFLEALRQEIMSKDERISELEEALQIEHTEVTKSPREENFMNRVLGYFTRKL